jgi:putative transposase
VVPRNRYRLALHRAGKADAKRLDREFQRQLRDELLKETLFLMLAEARSKIAAWKEDYNRIKPHSSLGNLTPEEFAMKTRLEMKAA